MRKVLKNQAVQTFAASILCILAGLLIGYIVLLFINPQGASESILNIIKNFFTWSRPQSQLKQFGNTLAKTMPLIMCSLSILFAYKVGLFNIGTAGQYVAGACASLYAALAWHWGWLPCMLLAMIAASLLGAITGILKAYCNVNEVISGIMLNWISLYTANTILSNVKETASPYTLYLNKELRQTDQDVTFYTGCMKKIHFTAFAGFFLSVALLTLLHYSFLHTPVFRDSQRILVWVIYCTLILLFMLAAWRRPYHYYNGKIEKCLKKLEEAMDTYISGYYDKARNFRAYINELNQLDECTRYLRLLTETNNESMLQARLYLWNKVQVRLHLEKLSFFRGLFEYGPVEASGEDTGAAFETPESRLDQDVIHNPLFWP